MLSCADYDKSLHSRSGEVTQTNISFALFPFFCLKRCPVKAQVMTKFVFDQSTGLADSTIFSMFKFPGNEQVHLQCDVGVCRGEFYYCFLSYFIFFDCDKRGFVLSSAGSCGTPICEGDDDALGVKGSGNTQIGQAVAGEEGILLAGTSFFVLQPGDPRKSRKI